MMRTVCRTLVFAACAFVLHPLSVSAQEVGDQVVARTTADLKVKDAIVETVDKEDILTVERVQDKWLWVATSSGTKGWVKADLVQPYADSAPDSPDDSAPDSPDEPLDPVADRLYLIGALGGAHVYTTYAYIGVLADGLSKELYTPEQTKTLLGEIVSVSDSLVKNLTRVRDGGLTESDGAAISNMIDIYKLLQDEARAAIAFSESKTVEDAQKFEEARTTVWPKISELLGLDAEPETPEE
jgi:hypothetical protein